MRKSHGRQTNKQLIAKKASSGTAPSILGFVADGTVSDYNHWISSILPSLILTQRILASELKSTGFLPTEDGISFWILNAIDKTQEYITALSGKENNVYSFAAHVEESILQLQHYLHFYLNSPRKESHERRQLIEALWEMLFSELAKLDLYNCEQFDLLLNAWRDTQLKSETLLDGLTKIASDIRLPYTPGCKIHNDNEARSAAAKIAAAEARGESPYKALVGQDPISLLRADIVAPNNWHKGCSVNQLNRSHQSQLIGNAARNAKTFTLIGFPKSQCKLKITNLDHCVRYELGGTYAEIPTPEAIAFIDVLVVANRSGNGFVHVPKLIRKRDGKPRPTTEFFNRYFNIKGEHGSLLFRKRFITYYKSLGEKGPKGQVRLGIDPYHNQA